VENIIIKFVADTSGLEPAIKQLQLLGKITDEDAAKFNAINQEQKEFIQNVNKSATEFGKLSNEVEDLAKTMSQNVLGKAADELEQFTNSSTEAMQGAKSLKAELRDLKKQIASGNFSGKELEQMTKRAAELTDHLGDVNEKIKALSSDTKRIDAMVGAMKGVAAAASVAAGATALFGTENKQMAEAAQKAQAAMALLAGVQEIAALATSENAAKTLFLDGAQKLATVSSRVLGVTITTSMAAATMGLSLVIAAVAGLALSMNDAKDKQQRLTEEMERAEKQLQAQLDLYQRIGKIRSDGYKFQADLAQAQGKSDKEILDLRLKGIQEELDANSRQKGYLMKGDKDYYAKLGELVNKEIELKREKALLITQFDKKQADSANKLTEDAKKAAQEIAKLEEEENKRLRALNAERLQMFNELDDEIRLNKMNAYKAEQDDFEQNLQKQLQLQYDANQVLIDDYNRMMSEKEIARQKEIQAEKEKAEEQKRLQEAVTAAAIDAARVLTDTLFTIGQQNRQATFDAEIEQLNRLRENELANKNLTEAQRAQIEKRYAQEEAKLKRQAWEQQKAADLAQAIINTALAVTKSFATLGYPAGIPGAIAAGIQGAAQIAVIANTKPPKFADGTEFLVGAGTGRSDNNLAYLSHGERVVPAAVNSDYFPALSAIHNREVEPTFANNILTALANGTFELAAQYQSAQGSSKKSLDYDKLGKVLERNKSNVNISIDENGFNKYVEKMHSRTEFRNTKMRIKV
jgi:myosin heavy subunit